MAGDARAIQERLLKDRIVFLGAPIDDFISGQTVAQLLFLQQQNSQAPVSLYVVSPGGALNPALAIIHMMDNLSCPVHTYALANADALAAVIVAHGARGHRFALPAARLSISACWRNPGLAVAADDNVLAGPNALIADLLTKDTGQFIEQVVRDLAAGRRFSSGEAKAYGLVDEILER